MSEISKEKLLEYGLTMEQAEKLLNNQSENVEYTKEVKADVVKQATVTSIADLRTYAKGHIVKLPDFADGQPFIARLRRPSMLVLAKKGKIPNTLMSQASKLFAGGSDAMNTSDPELLPNLSDLLEVICEASLLEPTLAEIEEIGLDLTDEQMMEIFNYSQTGTKALTPIN